MKRRIVSTTPNVTEILFALGLGDRVVGVTDYCRNPPEARSRTRIGTYAAPDIERILTLKPDLTIVQKLPNDLAAKLRRVGLLVLEIRHGSIEETLASIAEIAGAAEAPLAGDKLIASIRGGFDAVRARVAKRPPRGMAFIVGRNAGAIEGLIAVGPGSYLNGLMEIAGGRNVFGATLAAYPKIGVESLIATKPEVIVDMGDMADGSGLSPAKRAEIVALWARNPSILAVRTGRVFPVSNDVFVVPGPRMPEAAREFARMLHPEAFR